MKEQKNTNFAEIAAEVCRLQSVAPKWTPALLRESVIDCFSIKWGMYQDEVTEIVDSYMASLQRELMKSGQFATVVANIEQSLPAVHGYEKGFKDALESIALALAPTIAIAILDDAITTTLDAYANNVDGADTVTLDLNVFDDVGNVVDGTTATLSVEQLSDILDHASQLILIRRDGQSLDNVLDELDDALSVADVIEAAA